MNNLHSKRISIQALLSLIFFFINIPFLEYIDVLPEFLFIIPIAEIIFFLVLVIKERKEFETKRPKFRLVFLIISLVFLALSLLLLKDDPEYSLLEISASIVIFLMYSNMIINFISAIIVYKFEQEVYKQSQQIDELDGVEIKNNVKTMPLGYVSKKDHTVTTIVLLSTTFLLTVLFIVLNDGKGMQVFTGLLFFLSLFIVFFVMGLVRVKIISKPFRDFENDFNIKVFEEKLNKIIQNEKVNLETRNYYKLVLANYIGIFSTVERKKLLDEVFIPNHAEYKLVYYQIITLDLETKEEVYEVHQKAKEDPTFKSKLLQKRIDSLLTFNKKIFGDIKIENIDKAFPQVGNTKLSKINVYVSKLKYYYYQNDVEKNHNIKKELDIYLESIPVFPKNYARIEKFTL